MRDTSSHLDFSRLFLAIEVKFIAHSCVVLNVYEVIFRKITNKEDKET